MSWLIDTMSMDQKINMVMKMIGDLRDDFRGFCVDNNDKHNEIIAQQKITNGSVARLKRGQLLSFGIIIGVIVTLFIIGLLPERIYELFKIIV